MLLDNLKEIKISEICEKLKQNKNGKYLLFCYDDVPDEYIIYNLPISISTVTLNFRSDLHQIAWMKDTLSAKNADICLITKIYNNPELLNTLLEIIKTGKIDNNPCNIKQWVLFSQDNEFISTCDSFIQNFEHYKFITEEVTYGPNDQEEDFQNMVGHIEEDIDNLNTEELVEWYAIFDESNIVTEDVFQVKFEDDVYTQGDNIDVTGIVKDFKTVDEMTDLMKSSASNAQNDPAIIDTLSDEEGHKNTIEAAVGMLNAVNDFGHYITSGFTCPICGKHVKFIPSNGFCSLKCAAKHLLNKISACLTGEYELDTPKVIDQIKNIMEYFNLAFNIVSKIPDLLASVATLPEEYKNYATAKINVIFLDIKKIINQLLIKKNELIVYLLSKIKYGTIDDKMTNLFADIQSVMNTAEALREQFENSLQVAYKAITKVNALFYIGPQEYGFFTTLKSQSCFCPYYKTDVYTYPSDQLGRPFWGSGVMNIAFDMSLCQITFDVGAKSALKNVDMQKIMNAIRKAFPPITTPEYLMDPDLFDVRLALSDQNSTFIQSLINLLQETMVLGGDFLPEYKNLKLTNIWFVIAILTCWGPWTRAIFGDFIFHSWI